jgi:hypothetical protein
VQFSPTGSVHLRFQLRGDQATVQLVVQDVDSGPVDLDVRDNDKLAAVVRALVTVVAGEHGRDARTLESSVDLRLESRPDDDVVAWLSMGADDIGQAEHVGARSYRFASLLNELNELLRRERQ